MLRIFKYIIRPLAIGLVIGLVLSQIVYFTANFVFAVKTISETQLYQYVGASTMMLVNPDNEGSGGTGFVVTAPSGRVYTLTNAHVCAISQHPFLIAKQNSKRMRLQIIEISQTTDLCVLAAPPGMRALHLGQNLSLAEHVNLVGHPFLQPLTIKSGYTVLRQKVEMNYCEALQTFMPAAEVSSIFGECLKEIDSVWASLDSKPGNSGSSVTNDGGEVVGVLYAGNNNGTSLIIPLEHVVEFLSTF